MHPSPTMQPNSSEFPPHVTERQKTILGWPTDTLSIDYLRHDDNAIPEAPHTILVLIPGNPGQYDWYVSDLCTLIHKLGRGYAARSVSHAGHSLRNPTPDDHDDDENNDDDGILNVEEYANHNNDADCAVPWTIRGQVQHKCVYMEDVMAEFHDRSSSSSPPPPPRFIFLGHSFGCFVVQQLCLLRPKILERTLGFLHLMPFIRMKADYLHQCKLDWGARHPKVLIALGTIATHAFRVLPKAWVNALVKLSIHDDKTGDIAVRLMRQPTFARNFFTLGTEEIRDIPKDIDIQTINALAKSRPIFMLFAGNDQWAPAFHMTDIARLQAKDVLSSNIFMTYLPELRHDYVSHDGMPTKVVGWCYQCISSLAMNRSSSLKRRPINVAVDSDASRMTKLRAKL